MKKFFIFLMIFALLTAVSCSSSKKEGTTVIDDSDYDTDDNDNDIAEIDESDDEETETDEPDDSDSDPVAGGPCSKNPCKNIENSTGECVSEEEGYSCKCKENYTWEGYAWEGPRCKADERKKKCTGLPENAQWTKVSEVTQTWNGEEWMPSETAVYSEEISYNRCYFKCLPAYLWDGEKCAEPCENEPCKDIPNSTGVCFNSTAGRYICECDENFWWWGERRGCIAQRPALANICTGMYSCYNNGEVIECPDKEDEVFYGQDAYYAKLGFCSPKNFAVNSEFHGETIIVNRNTGLEWHLLSENTAYSWSEAADACGNLSYAGKHDWRLPKLYELMSIAAVTNEDKELNEIYFPLQVSAVWASEIFQYNNQPWSLSISSGITSALFNNYNQPAAVCVRGEKSPDPVFEESTVNGDKVLTDSASGLMWQKDYTSKGMAIWKEALFYCENLIYAGYSDWRLPNKNELASIINYGQDDDSWPLDMPSDYGFWTSTTFFSSYMTNELAIVIEPDGKQGYMPKHNKFYHYPYHVRCVR
ncbi:DUF1566 domain-containing protein [bacterium]|nr:DUF1566 domain-containing protein [bacterium]